MPDPAMPIPVFPQLPSRVLRLLPLAPLSLSLTAYAKSVAKHHPGLFRRLGEHANARFLLDPTDLPFAILLEPRQGSPKVTVTRKSGGEDAKIAGPMAALLGLVHGAYDGDALFFSRDLVVQGDTAAALALRNAVDDAELDMTQELSNLPRPLAQPLKQLAALAERRTGVCLSRPEESMAW
ncbi:SCP2 domain-containing protein [Aliisedimentitalea scapharcae]